MHLRVLGVLGVTREGGPVELGGGRVRALLGLLLLYRRRTVTAEQAVDALWGEAPPRTADKALQNQVVKLRRLLGADAVVTEGNGYRLDVTDDDVDAGAFERLLDEGRTLFADDRLHEARARVAEALGLWRGPAWQDLPDLAAAIADAARLGELRLVALELGVEADLALGRHRDVIPQLESLCADHPLRERLWALRMLALYRAGRQADALRAYQDLRRHL